MLKDCTLFALRNSLIFSNFVYELDKFINLKIIIFMKDFIFNTSLGKRFSNELNQFFLQRVTIFAHDVYEFNLVYNVGEEMTMFNFEELIILCRRYDVCFYMSANDYNSVTFLFRKL